MHWCSFHVFENLNSITNERADRQQQQRQRQQKRIETVTEFINNVLTGIYTVYYDQTIYCMDGAVFSYAMITESYQTLQI